MKTLSESTIDALVAHQYQASIDEILDFVIKERGGVSESTAKTLRHSLTGVLSRLKKKGVVVSVELHDFKMVRRPSRRKETPNGRATNRQAEQNLRS